MCVENRMMDDGAKHLAEALVHPESLEHLASLNLSSKSAILACGPTHVECAECEITEPGARHICDALIHPTGPKCLTDFNLSSIMILNSDDSLSLRPSLVNRIGDGGAKVIFDTLIHPEGPRSITSLGLAGEPEGVFASESR